MTEFSRIEYKDFEKLDLRVATIKEAVLHPNADKLLVLKIQLENEERQLVAGLRQYYKPEELIGKQVIVIANLKPAKLRGVESQGMLLAADNGKGKVVFVTPEKKIENASKIY